MKEIAVDTTVPADAVNDNFLEALLPSLELREGVTHTLRIFASGQGELRALAPVTTPPGPFRHIQWR